MCLCLFKYVCDFSLVFKHLVIVKVFLRGDLYIFICLFLLNLFFIIIIYNDCLTIFILLNLLKWVKFFIMLIFLACSYFFVLKELVFVGFKPVVIFIDWYDLLLYLYYIYGKFSLFYSEKKNICFTNCFYLFYLI